MWIAKRTIVKAVVSWSAMVLSLVGPCQVFAELNTIARTQGEKDGSSAEDNEKVDSQKPRWITDVKPPFTFVIHTVRSEGKPQKGVRVRCVHPRARRAEPIVDVIEESDENGKVVFTLAKADLVTDRYFFFSIADEHYIGRKVGLSPIDNDFRWNFDIVPADELELQFLDSGGRPICEAATTICLRSNPKDAYKEWSGIITGPEGRIKVRFVKDKVELVAKAHGYASKVIREARLATESPYVIKLAVGLEITGKVVGPEGQPLAGMLVTAQKNDLFHNRDEFILKAITDATGNFVLRNASEGDWEVLARSQDGPDQYFAGPVTLVVMENYPLEPVQLVAARGFRLRGRYLSRYRTNPTEEHCRHRIEFSTFSPMKTRWEVQIKEDGSFDLCGLPAGAHGRIYFVGIAGFYRIIRLPQDYVFLEIEDDEGIRFRDVPAGTYDNIEVQFLLTGMIAGKVRNSSGAPLSNQKVCMWPGGRIGRTDGKGRYSHYAPPVENAKLVVLDPKTNKPIFETEPFNVQEGEIIERDIVIGENGSVWTRLVGKRLPRFEDVGIAFSPERGENKKILLCFFDMNQRPSRHVVKELVKRADEVKEKGIVVVCVQGSKIDKAKLDEWIEDNDIPFSAGLIEDDVGKVGREWGVRSLPWLILADRKHVVVAEGFGLEELDEKVKEAGSGKK